MISKKLMVIGEIGVGKTSLVRRLVLNEFTAAYIPTMGVDLYRYQAREIGPVGKDSLELVIWDIDGNFGHSVFRHVYGRGASGALIVGDLTSARTLESMVTLGRGFEENMPGRHYAFVLNKTDVRARREDIVLPEALRPEALEKSRVPLLWTSAATGDGVKEAFHAAADSILRRDI